MVANNHIMREVRLFMLMYIQINLIKINVCSFANPISLFESEMRTPDHHVMFQLGLTN